MELMLSRLDLLDEYKELPFDDVKLEHFRAYVLVGINAIGVGTFQDGHFGISTAPPYKRIRRPD